MTDYYVYIDPFTNLWIVNLLNGLHLFGPSDTPGELNWQSRDARKHLSRGKRDRICFTVSGVTGLNPVHVVREAFPTAEIVAAYGKHYAFLTIADFALIKMRAE